MKVNDKIPVTIAGQQVAVATVKEMSEGTATLIVPATRVVMATRTELTVEEKENEVEVLITGVGNEAQNDQTLVTNNTGTDTVETSDVNADNANADNVNVETIDNTESAEPHGVEANDGGSTENTGNETGE